MSLLDWITGSFSRCVIVGLAFSFLIMLAFASCDAYECRTIPARANAEVERCRTAG